MRFILKTAAVVTALVIGFVTLLYLYNAILGLGEKGDTTVPDLHGKTVDQARAVLQRSSLSLHVQRFEFSDNVPKDGIVSQEPDPGMQVKSGRPVQVVVSTGTQLSVVPDLRGLDLREAEIQLENNRLKAGNIKYTSHQVAKKDVVVDQDPQAGENLKGGSPVDLTVSTGPPAPVTMPSLVGNDLDYAKTILENNKLQMGQIGWRWDEDKPAGAVLTQNPNPGEKIPQGSMVSLVISAGVKEADLPFKQSYITILLPRFDGEKKVSVLVTDETTTNLVYEGMHSGREKIRLMVSGYGDSSVQVKLGDQVLSTGKL